MNELVGKVAVITGGSRGLGYGIVLEYLKAGAKVVVASRSEKSVESALKSLQSYGESIRGFVCDVSDHPQTQALVQFTLQTFGKMDIWVNNAGVAGPYGATLDWSPDAFRQVVDTNILGTYYGSRAAMKHFTTQRSGKLINILGAGWNKPIPYQNAYSSSKIWIRWFTRSLAEETRDTGVGVFTLNPGMVLTELLTDVEVFESARNRLEKFPMVVRVLAKPPEVPAKRMVWLASAATDGKTGLELNVFNPLAASMGFLQESIRSWFNKPEPGSEVKMKVIPPFD